MKTFQRLNKQSPVLGVYLFFLLLTSGLVALGLVFSGEFTHDEHQFVAAGELLANNSLLPYVNYPYHHSPNLVFIYALIFKLSSYSLLPARLFSAMCLFTSSILLASITHALLGKDDSWKFKVLALMVSLTFLLNPLTKYTGSRAWNHDFPLMLSLLMTWLLLTQKHSVGFHRMIFFSSLSLGIAIGSRLSFAALVIPYFGYFLFLSRKHQPPVILRNIILGFFGLSIGLLPLVILTGLSPNRSIFGNITYPRLSHTYYRLVDNPVAMTFLGKINYLLNILRNNPGLGILAITLLLAFTLLTIISFKKSNSDKSVTLFMFSLLAALMIGSLAPTPSWFQYFYAPLPFGLLAIISISRVLPSERNPLSLLITIGLILTFTINLHSNPPTGYLKVFSHIESSVPINIHRLGISLREKVPSGTILTLAPIIPLEANLEIYPAFATGPFTWRVGELLSVERRRLYDLVSSHELEEYLQTEMPAGILTGMELDNPGLTYLDKGGLERPLEEYAAKYGYKPVYLDGYNASIPKLWIPQN
jgi:hypothetical protein